MVSHSLSYIQICSTLVSGMLKDVWGNRHVEPYIVVLQGNHIVLNLEIWGLSEILSRPIQPQPRFALLNLDIDTYLHHLPTIMIHILLEARLMISRNCKNIQASSFILTLNLVHIHCQYELMWASNKSILYKSLKQWSP